MKLLWTGLGIVVLAVACVGIVLPLLPATPLILFSGFCFCRGSERMHVWLTTHRLFGPVIAAFRDGVGIPMRAKTAAVATTWASLAASMLVVEPLPLRIMLAVIGLSISVYLVFFIRAVSLSVGIFDPNGVADVSPGSAKRHPG